MNHLRILMQAKRLAQRPPSWRRIVFLAVVIGASLVVAGIEAFVGWPDWLTPDSLHLKP